MKQKDFLNIVPGQYTGKNIQTEVSRKLTENEEAKSLYLIARERLLNVNKWHSLAGFISGVFQLSNEHGEKLDRLVRTGDYIKIDIPGPGSPEGDGYDWVFVEEVKETDTEMLQGTGFRVRPSTNPLNNSPETAHFYSNEATSSFIVIRDNKQVTVQIIDVNLRPNDENNSLKDSVRNVVIGVGALGLFSKIQWKNLAEGIISSEKK